MNFAPNLESMVINPGHIPSELVADYVIQLDNLLKAISDYLHDGYYNRTLNITFVSPY